MNDIKYWEYVIEVWEDEDASLEEKERCGIVVGNSMAEALDSILYYYEENHVINILTLKCISDDPVFDFDIAKDEGDFDFNVMKKESKL